MSRIALAVMAASGLAATERQPPVVAVDSDPAQPSSTTQVQPALLSARQPAG